MPTYDYQCLNCEYTFEDQYKMDDRLIPESMPCPNCNTTDGIRLVVGTPLIHSGRGLQKTPTAYKEVLSKIAQTHKNHKFGHLL